PHPPHDGRKIDLHPRWNAYSKLSSIAHLGYSPSRPDQRLGRYAADIETIAAQEFAFDQGDLGAEPGSTGSGDQSRRAGADHNEVVPTRGRRANPVRRVHVLD